jgi:hypothetical protein
MTLTDKRRQLVLKKIKMMMFQRILPSNMPCGKTSSDHQATLRLREQVIPFERCHLKCGQAGDVGDPPPVKLTSAEDVTVKCDERCLGCELHVEGRCCDVKPFIFDWADCYASLRTSMNRSSIRCRVSYDGEQMFAFTRRRRQRLFENILSGGDFASCRASVLTRLFWESVSRENGLNLRMAILEPTHGYIVCTYSEEAQRTCNYSKRPATPHLRCEVFM